MRAVVGLVTAIGVAVSGTLWSGAVLAPAALVALSATTTPAEAAGRHKKGSKQKRNNKSRKSRNTRKNVSRDVDVDIDVDHNDGGSFVGGLVVGAATATIINEATKD